MLLELEQYRRQFEQIADQAKELTSGLTEAQFNWRPAADRWSIEDCLAHLTLVVENVSIVAAIEVLDEPLVDAQESSTRYQDFTKRRYYTPPEVRGSAHEARYRETPNDRGWDELLARLAEQQKKSRGPGAGLIEAEAVPVAK